MLKAAKTTVIGAIGLLVVGTMCEFSYGAPAVGSVAGNFVQGGSVSISGTGFGIGDTTPMLWDDFEGGTVGQNLSASPKIGAWHLNNTPNAKYTDQHHRSGSKSSMGSASSGNIYTQFGVPASDNMSDTYYYASWWGKYNNPCSAPGQVKMIQLWGTYKVGDYNPGVFYGGGSSAYIALERTGMAQEEWPYIPDSGSWNFFELILKQSDVNTANGYVTIKVNGSDVYKRNNVKTREIAGQSWERFYVWEGMTNQSGCSGMRYLALDDFYMNNSWARVELGNHAAYGSCTLREIQIPSAWSSTSITINFNQGALQAGQTAYLYVVDANGTVNSQGYPVVVGGGSGDALPTINITSPTSESNYLASQSTVQIAGSASDNNGVTNVAWSNSRGGSGTAVNNSGTWSSWSTGNIGLLEGENVITVTATDTANQSVTDTLNVTYSSMGIVQAWSATAQTGDSSWTSSSVTYCVRLLIEGSKVTQSGNQIQLGFQGRASGNYTIKKVSIAKRDTAGLKGDVVDSTWTKVTFDGKSVSTWATDIITVPAGLEKPSNAIAFPLQAGNDYYVTFKIETASVDLDPPSTYRELYFYGADHTDDIDWGQNGHSSMQVYPALSRIYVLSGNGTATPIAPKNLKLK